jgi:MoxR-like ATPase
MDLNHRFDRFFRSSHGRNNRQWQIKIRSSLFDCTLMGSLQISPLVSVFILHSITCEPASFPVYSPGMSPIRKIQQDHGIVGRDEELALSLAILKADRHLLLEGPVGVGKTTIALAVARHLERPSIRVDGDDRYTEAKLTGWFDPQQVLAAGYGPHSFIEGPLTQAMRQGAILFINELNRMPESVQNVLLPALDERLLILPQISTIRAQPGFLVIATQNPVEYIATGHLSEALKDRFEHVVLNYQTEDEETRIVQHVTACKDDTLIREAVALTRLTRIHPLFKKGASIRAAIAMVLIARHLTGADRLTRAARAALATRVELRDEEERGLNVALDELLVDLKKKG